MNKRLVWNFEINNENPLNIPETSTEDTERWESRFFWPEHEIIVLNGLDDRFLELSRYQAKHRHDTYCLLPDSDDNIKIRRDQILYKPVITKSACAIAYGKKITLEESVLLAQVQHDSQRIEVEKEALIYKFETIPKLKLELARLRIGNAIYYSTSVESRSRVLVASVAKQVLGRNVSCDYVEFLKGLS